jgi:hypothetical protein
MANIILTGRVVDSTNISEGVPFTNVKITPNPGTVGFATDVDGNIFTSINLNKPGEYNFEFTSVGYSPQTIQKTITTNSINFGVIKLVESNTVLDEFEVVAEETIKDFSIKGTIVDSNKKPISGVLIESSKGETTRSQNKGNFNLTGRYNKNTTFTLTISSPKYNTISDITPFTLDNEIINDLGIYSLILLEKDIKIAEIVLRVLPYIPSTSFTPIPVGPFLDAKDLIKALKDLLALLKGKLGNNSFQLNFLIEDLNKAIQMLAILDTVIQGCADEITNNNSNSTLEDQEKISNELLKSTQEQSQQLSPVVTNVNGFEMSVVSVDSQIVGGLKRRQAVARNLAGVIMLKGEPSFSSNDQILIDELIYYIETNDLKAD